MGVLSMISIITPTSRGKESLELVEKSLSRQTEQNFEWIVEYASQPLPGNVWSLNRDYNTAIKKAKGDLIISWQDFTYADPECLEKFLFHYNQEPKTLVTAVGNKYSDNTWSIMTWKDPRERSDQGTYYPCFFNDIEFNLCSIPKEALYDIGGFDEYLDKFYGMDGYSVVDRINMLNKYDFKIDQTIRSYSLEHSRPALWEEKNALHGPYNDRRLAYLANPTLSYLTYDNGRK